MIRAVFRAVALALAMVALVALTVVASPDGSGVQLLARYLSCDKPILGPYMVDGQSMVFYDKVCNKEPVPTAEYLSQRDRELHEKQIAYHNYLKERAGL